MRCGRCGNENAEANRFCGMCGASLIATAAAGGQSSGQAPTAPSGDVVATKPAVFPVPAAQQAPTASRAARPSTEPAITGPSFLGLSTPGPYVDREVDHRRDPQAGAGRDPLRASSNLDYLLEDEEEPSRGWGKVILVVVALALAVGFGYLHWKQGGFDWLNAGAKKPAAATKQGADAGQGGADGGSAAGAATAQEGGTPAAEAGGTTPAASGAATSPGESGAPSTTSAPGSLPSNSATTSPAPSSAPSSSPSSTPSSAPQTTASQDASQTASSATPSQTTPSPTTRSATQAADPNLPASSEPQAAGANSGQQSAAVAPAAGSKAAARKPSPARAVVAKPVDPVTEAERYIYGRGVSQDCDRGLRLLKAPAQQSNSRAMISLGALYSTGTCTPRDLPTAYRWFALALHKDPDNQALQNDLQKLWGQMTQPERQLAIKLSQ